MSMRHLTAEETRTLGIVMELNRRELHPRGLALELSFDPEAPDEPGVLRIQDHRSDPEGVYFAELDENDVAKSGRFDALAERIARGRLSALGYLVQPLDLVTEPSP